MICQAKALSPVLILGFQMNPHLLLAFHPGRPALWKELFWGSPAFPRHPLLCNCLGIPQPWNRVVGSAFRLRDLIPPQRPTAAVEFPHGPWGFPQRQRSQPLVTGEGALILAMPLATAVPRGHPFSWGRLGTSPQMSSLAWSSWDSALNPSVLWSSGL